MPLSACNLFIGAEQAQLRNSTAADKVVTIVVEGFGGEAGTYMLNVDVLGSVCRLGESACDGDVRRTCNDDGTAFLERECAAGCTFDAFDQVATCNQECGAPGTLFPQETCDGDDLIGCVDGLVERQRCDVTCTDPVNGDARCTFGVCDDVGEIVCTDFDSDPATDDAIVLDCSNDGGFFVVEGCPTGRCNAAGTGCLDFPVALDPPIEGDDGDCDLDSVARLAVSGVFTYELEALQNNFEFTDSNGVATEGGDVFWIVPARAPGVTVTIDVDAADEVFALLTETATCAELSVIDFAFGAFGDAPPFSYTFQAGDADLVLILDGYGDFPFDPGELTLSIIYPDEESATPVCQIDDESCDDGVAKGRKIDCFGSWTTSNENDDKSTRQSRRWHTQRVAQGLLGQRVEEMVRALFDGQEARAANLSDASQPSADGPGRETCATPDLRQK